MAALPRPNNIGVCANIWNSIIFYKVTFKSVSHHFCFVWILFLMAVILAFQ